MKRLQKEQAERTAAEKISKWKRDRAEAAICMECPYPDCRAIDRAGKLTCHYFNRKLKEWELNHEKSED